MITKTRRFLGEAPAAALVAVSMLLIGYTTLSGCKAALSQQRSDELLIAEEKRRVAEIERDRIKAQLIARDESDKEIRDLRDLVSQAQEKDAERRKALEERDAQYRAAEEQTRLDAEAHTAAMEELRDKIAKMEEVSVEQMSDEQLEAYESALDDEERLGLLQDQVAELRESQREGLARTQQMLIEQADRERETQADAHRVSEKRMEELEEKLRLHNDLIDAIEDQERSIVTDGTIEAIQDRITPLIPAAYTGVLAGGIAIWKGVFGNSRSHGKIEEARKEIDEITAKLGGPSRSEGDIDELKNEMRADRDRMAAELRDMRERYMDRLAQSDDVPPPPAESIPPRPDPTPPPPRA